MKSFKAGLVIGLFIVFGLPILAKSIPDPGPSCYSKHGTTDSARRTTELAVEYEYMRMGKSYLLEGKSTEDKIIMFCAANKG